MQFEETERTRGVKKFGTGAIPEGLVASGVITDTAKLAALLREALADKKFQYVALALPEEKGFVRTIRMPQIDPDEIREAVALQLEEYVPLPPEDTSFAYHILPEDDPTSMDVLIAAYPTPLITQYRDMVIKAGFTPVSLEIESQAVARAIIPAEKEKEAVLVVDIGLTRTSFLFAKNGYTQLTSTIPVGGKTIHEAIMKALNVSEEKAEQLKIQHGIGHTKEGAQVYEALLPLITTVQNEIQRRIEYWREKTRNETKNQKAPELHHVYLCGREANLIGLPSHLFAQLHVPVTLPNVWVNALPDKQFVPEIEFRDSLGYATSIGLALGV